MSRAKFKKSEIFFKKTLMKIIKTIWYKCGEKIKICVNGERKEKNN